MKACTPITMLQYEWAGDDERYYVFIEVQGNYLTLPESLDTNLQGWIGLNLVTFGD
jgi:hypothetical protein